KEINRRFTHQGRKHQYAYRYINNDPGKLEIARYRFAFEEGRAGKDKFQSLQDRKNNLGYYDNDNEIQQDDHRRQCFRKVDEHSGSQTLYYQHRNQLYQVAE